MLCGAKNKLSPQSGQPYVYDDQWVIIVQMHTSEMVWVRYEDDRTNTEYLVPTNKLK